MAWQYALLAAVAVPVSAFLALFVKVTPLLAEVGLDVVRYLGDDTYRADLRAQLRPELRPPADGTALVLVGHSLGSVVCLDLLLNDPIVQPDCPVVLVTCGSPIRRWFMRFFRGYCSRPPSRRVPPVRPPSTAGGSPG